MNNQRGFANIIILIFVVIALAGIGSYFVLNHQAPPPPPITTPTPKASPPVPTVIPPVTPTPAPTTKQTPAPAPVPTPIQSQELQPGPNIFVIHDDGTIIQPDNYINLFQLSRKFYSLYPDKDIYDFLNIFTTFDGSYKIAFHLPVKNEIKGINIPITASTESMGSSRLLAVNYLGYQYFLRPGSSQEDIKANFWVISHEINHYWVMYVGKDFGLSDGSHYTKWADTGFIRDGEQWNDLVGGFPWKDNGDGTASVNNIKKQGFSNLSLYAMGLIPASEVHDMKIFLPENPQDPGFQNVRGKFKTLSINDIITKSGERIPSYQNSQKNFRMAYIILAKKGETLAQYQLNAINYIAQSYPSEWNYMTHGKSTINQ